MATANIIRYGNENAIVGPWVKAWTSASSVDSLWTGGGGSIMCEGDLAIIGSGRSVMVSPDEVSIVICLVCDWDLRIV